MSSGLIFHLSKYGGQLYGVGRYFFQNYNLICANIRCYRLQLSIGYLLWFKTLWNNDAICCTVGVSIAQCTHWNIHVFQDNESKMSFANCLLLGTQWHQANTRTNPDLSFGYFRMTFSKIRMQIQKFPITQMHLKMSCANFPPFCADLTVLLGHANRVLSISVHYEYWKTHTIINISVAYIDFTGRQIG